MEEVLASPVSPTGTIDCFSDEELELYEPPTVRNSHTDENPEVPKCVTKNDLSVVNLTDVTMSSSYKSAYESRDDKNDNMTNEAEPEVARDPETCDAFDPSSGKDESLCTDKGGVEHSLTVESINRNHSNISAVPNPSRVSDKAKSFESANWPIDSSKISKTDSTAWSIVNPSLSKDGICAPDTLKSREDANVQGEIVEELLLVKKPTVSFADESSQSKKGINIQRTSSGLSKKSVKSRMSFFSSEKSKSNDSACGTANKSTNSIKSGERPSVLPRDESIVVEKANSNAVVDQEQSSLVVLGLSNQDNTDDSNPDAVAPTLATEEEVQAFTYDKDNIPEVEVTSPEPELIPSLPRQDSKKSKKSKVSSRSLKSSGTRKLAIKTSRSLDESAKKAAPSVTTPKLFGPPQKLSRWGGIPKPAKSVRSSKSRASFAAAKEEVVEDAKNTDVAVLGLEPIDVEGKSQTLAHDTSQNEKAVVASEAFNESKVPSQSLAAFAPSERRAGLASETSPALNDEYDEVEAGAEGVGEDILDATSTLTSKSSKQHDADQNDADHDDAIDQIDEDQIDAEQQIDEKLKDAMDQIDDDQNDVMGQNNAMNQNDADQNKADQNDLDQNDANQTLHPSHSKKSTLTENISENVGACNEGAKEMLDDDLVADDKVCPPLTVEVNDPLNDPIKTVMEPFSPIEVPVCATIEDTILKTVSPASLSLEKMEEGKDTETIKVTAVETSSPKEPPRQRVKDVKSLMRNVFRKSNTTTVCKTNHVLPDTSGDSIPLKSPSEFPDSDQQSVGVLSSKIGTALLSPKRRALIVASDNGIEAEVLKCNSPKTFISPRNFGMFNGKAWPNNTTSKFPAKAPDNAPDVDTDERIVEQVAVPIDDAANSGEKLCIADKSDAHDAEAPGSVSTKENEPEEYSDLEMQRGDSIAVPIESKSPKKIFGFFGRARLSNETKRQMASKLNRKSTKVTPKVKEHDVKLSAVIDENIIVENLVTNCEKGPKIIGEMKAAKVETHVEDTIPKQADVQATPVTVVDHRSSKKVEVVSKFENKAAASDEKETELSPNLFLFDIKTSNKSNIVEDNRVYTSDDTVTDTELTEVAKLDVPLLETARATPISVTISDERKDSVSGIKLTDSTRVDVKGIENAIDSEFTWMTTFIEWCTPKNSTDINKWMDCGVQGKGISIPTEKEKVNLPEKDQKHDSAMLNEVIAEFTECNDFYADSLTFKTNKNDKDIGDAGKDWSGKLMEWMSPKSNRAEMETAVALKTSTQVEPVTNGEPGLECYDVQCKVPDDNDVSNGGDAQEGPGNDTQENKGCEGTEISLTSLKNSADTNCKSQRRGHSMIKTLGFPFKKAKKSNQQVNEQSSKGEQPENAERRITRFGKLFANKTKKGKEGDSDNSPTENVDSPAKQMQTDRPNAALFTFTSDDCLTEKHHTGVQVGRESSDVNVVKQTFEKRDDVGPRQCLEEIENSVSYLELIKSQRQSRRNRKEEVEVQSTQDIIDDLDRTKYRVTAKNSGDNTKDIAFQYRVNAVSDEIVDGLETSESEATSTMLGGSFLSSKEDMQGKDSCTTSRDCSNVKKSKAIPTEKKWKPLVKPTKRIPESGIANMTKRVPESARKEEDSVGVSLNSALNSFNDDLSVAFAPKVGKWLW
jgi:hypothetical protein